MEYSGFISSLKADEEDDGPLPLTDLDDFSHVVCGDDLTTNAEMTGAVLSAGVSATLGLLSLPPNVRSGFLVVAAAPNPVNPLKAPNGLELLSPYKRKGIFNL